MLKIQIITIGKNKDDWLNSAIAEYEKRLKAVMQFKWKFVKNNQELIQATKELPIICLDSNGSSFTSEEFSQYFFSQVEKNGSKIAFVIGGADGIPKQVFDSSIGICSFSKLTFTHQQIRLLLVEQIYRAYEIQRGSSYHKANSEFHSSTFNKHR